MIYFLQYDKQKLPLKFPLELNWNLLWALERRPNLARSTQIIFVSADFRIFIASKGDIRPMTRHDLLLCAVTTVNVRLDLIPH